MKKCLECNSCLEKWVGTTLLGYVCSETYEDIINENEPLCEQKENINE